MPQFMITAPDGRKFKITAPDGATKEEALARVQQQYAPEGARNTTSREDRLVELKSSNPGEYDPTSPEFKAKYGATGTGYQNFMAGAGKAVVDTARGVRQLGADIGNKAGVVSDATVANLRAKQDDVNARDEALLNTGAGVAGNIAGNIATVVLPAGGVARGAQAVNAGRTALAARAFANPATYRAAAASGAIQGAVRPLGSGDSRTANVAAGAAFGAAGNAIANTVGRAVQPVKKALSGADKKAIDTLKAADIPLDASQLTGSKVLARTKAAMSDSPATVNGQQAFLEKQQSAFNKAALKEIGEDATAATADVMDRAAKRIGSYFDAVAERVPLKIDGKLGHDVLGIMRGAEDALLPEEAGVLSRLMQVVQQRGVNGELTGQQYQRIKMALDGISARGGPLGNTARDLRSSFDSALERSAAGTTDFKLLKDARRQWQALKQIEGAIDKEGGGNISPARLANILGQKASRSQSLYGRGNQRLVNLAQAGKRVLQEKTPNSGTPARLAAQLAPAALIGGGTALATGDFSTAAKVAGATYALPKIGQFAMNNPTVRNYLAEGMAPGIKRNAIERLGRNALLKQLPVSGGLALSQQ